MDRVLLFLGLSQPSQNWLTPDSGSIEALFEGGSLASQMGTAQAVSALGKTQIGTLCIVMSDSLEVRKNPCLLDSDFATATGRAEIREYVHAGYVNPGVLLARTHHLFVKACACGLNVGKPVGNYGRTAITGDPRTPPSVSVYRWTLSCLGGAEEDCHLPFGDRSQIRRVPVQKYQNARSVSRWGHDNTWGLTITDLVGEFVVPR